MKARPNPLASPTLRAAPRGLALALVCLVVVPKGRCDDTKPAPTAKALAEERARLDATVWADEVLAQEYETPFIDLWDRLRAATRKLDVLGLPFERVGFGEPGETKQEAWGVEVTPYRAAGETPTLTPGEFRHRLDALIAEGFVLEESEWHHAGFRNLKDGPRSSVRFQLHVKNEKRETRYFVKGTLEVLWHPPDAQGRPKLVARHIEAGNVEVVARKGTTFFAEGRRFEAGEVRGNSLADPILLYDLSGEGLSEVILAGRNEISWNRDGKLSAPEVFCEGLPPIFETAVLADFTGDGSPDFACIGHDGALRVYAERAGGKFVGPPILWEGARFLMPLAMTAGDIDGDGDLDLWIGQYKPPYQGGQMPVPYYDANDGHPAFLLENDGSGRFRDVTETAGLAAKRHRRSYGGSLVDLDEDGTLDLVVTSDFSGLDLYKGDGKGRFADVTSRWVGEARYGFGMSHVLDDFDGDGKLDIYMTGMGSTTARRLDLMGLKREENPDIDRMRAAMGYGNRMFLRRGDRFEEAPFKDEVARTGWSWGCSAFDFDNDGDRDLYVANGHLSGKSARDYCTTFWRHDIHIAPSTPAPALREMLTPWVGPLARGEISWNGYEHNALLMNRSGEGFLNIAYLMGVGFEFDARAVASDDLDGDGRVDLLVVENHRRPGGVLHQTLHVLSNRSEVGNHWIGVRLYGGKSPLGARVSLTTEAGTRIAALASGESLYAQHAPVAHFGLGKSDKVISLEVVWLDGSRSVRRDPGIDRYHDLGAPEN